jgi:hypothetical protein
MEKIHVYVTSSGSRRFNPSPVAYRPDKPFGSDTKPISIHTKIEQSKEVNQAPFPNLPTSIGEGPLITIGELHQVQKTPSPTRDYVPPPFGSEGRGSRMGLRTPELKRDDVPGPGFYDRSDGFEKQGRSSRR